MMTIFFWLVGLCVCLHVVHESPREEKYYAIGLEVSIMPLVFGPATDKSKRRIEVLCRWSLGLQLTNLNEGFST
jgi:hypothetical protein